MTTTSIRELNDAFRANFAGGHVAMTIGIGILTPESQSQLMYKVRTFSGFEKGNDPYNEHDFGSIDHDGEKFFWKIEYYNHTMESGSPDPSDPSVTMRVITIMRADEY